MSLIFSADDELLNFNRSVSTFPQADINRNKIAVSLFSRYSISYLQLPICEADSQRKWLASLIVESKRKAAEALGGHSKNQLWYSQLNFHDTSVRHTL